MGQSGTYEYEVKTRFYNGKEYHDNNLSNITKKTSPGGAGSVNSSETNGLLRQILEVLTYIKNHQAGALPLDQDLGPQDGEIDVSTIPF